MKHDQFGSLMNRFTSEAEALVAAREHEVRKQRLRRKIRRAILGIFTVAAFTSAFIYRDEITQFARISAPSKKEAMDALTNHAEDKMKGQIDAIKAANDKRNKQLEEMGK